MQPGGQITENREGLVNIQFPCIRLPAPQELNLLWGVTRLCCGKSGAAAETVAREFSRVIAGLSKAIIEGPERVRTGEGSAG
jgi:hypothetical protein